MYKAFFITSTLIISLIIAVLLFTRIPASINSTQSLSLSSLQTTPTPQPSVNLQEVNKTVAQGPKNTIAQGPPRPTKVSSPEPILTQPGKSEKFTIKSLDNDVMEIGTERHSPPKPYVKLSKWDGEATFKIHVPFNTRDNPEQVGDKLRYSGDKVKIDFYPRQPEEVTQKDSQGNDHKFIINEDGGVEFDTILDEKPTSNQIVFPLETQGLKFYYQSPLNQEQQEEGVTCTATTCTKNGKVTDFRPEEVVGSYAVYLEGKSGDYSPNGGKNYKTGKAFHIYRPKIIDAKGQEIWGTLKVNESEKTLTLSIDQNWLNNASYPIIIDPTFGYTAAGGTTGLNGFAGRDRIQAQGYAVNAGILTRINIYSKANSEYVRLGLYNDNASAPNSLLNGSGQIASSANNWIGYNTGSVALSGGITYWLSYQSDGSQFSYGYDSASNPTRYYKDYADQVSRPMPDPFPSPDASATNRTISIYGTYRLPEFRFNGLKMNGVKIQ